MMPVLFVCHGAPDLAVETNPYSQFLSELGGSLKRPKAIVIFSAHNERETPHFTYREDAHDTIYDFYGFPEELYRIKYPAVGSVETAERLEQLLLEAGIVSRRDTDRGLDHGAWVILRLMYPHADIPVVSVSVNRHLPPREQYRFGQAIAKLREEEVLVIASGGTSHNLRTVQWGATEPAEWTVQFDDWLVDKVVQWNLDALFAYEKLAPFARLAVPPGGNEHFIPLFIAMGCADATRQAKLLHRSYAYGTISLIAFQFD